MRASTKNQTSWGMIVFIFVMIAGLVVGGYYLYSYWKAQQKSPLEISLDPSFDTKDESISSSFSEDLPEESENVNIQHFLQTENDMLLARIEEMEIDLERLEQFKMGREVLNEFSTRFFKYEPLLNSNSFFQFCVVLAKDYVENKAVSASEINTSHPDFENLRREFINWVITQEDEKYIALANFLGFHLIEPLYQLPLTRVATGLSAEIEAIDFQMLVQDANAERPPVRDSNGELKMGKRVYLHDYTSAQQFLYRRGPLFSAKVLVFLKAYLAYDNH